MPLPEPLTTPIDISDYAVLPNVGLLGSSEVHEMMKPVAKQYGLKLSRQRDYLLALRIYREEIAIQMN